MNELVTRTIKTDTKKHSQILVDIENANTHFQYNWRLGSLEVFQVLVIFALINGMVVV